MSTSGRGPLDGPGTTIPGQGGSYGGSGGRLECNASYFSNIPDQVRFIVLHCNLFILTTHVVVPVGYRDDYP